MLHTKYQGSRPCGFRQEDFLSFHLENHFSLCYLDMQRTGTIGTIIKESHVRIIPAKFGKMVEMSFEGIFNDGRRTTDIQQSQYLTMVS